MPEQKVLQIAFYSMENPSRIAAFLLTEATQFTTDMHRLNGGFFLYPPTGGHIEISEYPGDIPADRTIIKGEPK